MDKYLVILSIITILYFAQKYCIQSEVEKILLTKNIVENFSDAVNPVTGGGLNILGNIILGNRHKISSNSENLKITDLADNLANISVKDIDVSGTLIIRQGFAFNGNNSFTNGNAILNINGPSISSTTGPLILNAPTSNIIRLGNNTNINGVFTINNIKPILTKIITSPVNLSTTPRNIDTGINSDDYPSIAFSGYVNSNSTNSQYASLIEFNTIKTQGGNWFISFTPQVTSVISVRLTFFHKNIVEVV
jgi:hypothetical protein